MKKNNSFLVDQEQTLLDFLLAKTNYKRKDIKKFILNKQIVVNDEIADSLSILLKVNDELKINFNIHGITQLTKQEMKFDILYEDEYLVVINKPSGLLVHQTNFEQDNTLFDLLIKQYPELINVERHGITHRLDKDTTGILVIAKQNDVFAKIQSDFENNKVIRKYHAIVLNQFKQTSGIFKIETQIGYQYNNKLKMTTNNPKNPKQAITLLKILKPLLKQCSLVECELQTGRTHQIRVHMKYINHPILNDPIYGTTINKDDFNQYLHCYYVKFFHPINFTPIEVIANYPKQFSDKLKELENVK